MVATPRINERDPRLLALLTSDQEFEVSAMLSKEDDEWCILRVPANFAQVTRYGALEFWTIVDDVWHPETFFAPGWWGTFHSVQKKAAEEVDFVYTEESVKAKLSVDVPESNPSLQAAFPGPRPREEAEDVRAQVLGDLARGVYPSVEDSGGVAPPRRLKEIWEGRGESLEAQEPLQEDDSWPRNSTQEDIDKWVADQEAKEQARADQLRAEADASRDVSVPLPEYLRDDFTSVPTPGVPHTTMVSADGGLIGATDVRGSRIEPTPSLREYSERVAAAAEDSLAYARQQREIVEDWHGRARETP